MKPWPRVLIWSRSLPRLAILTAQAIVVIRVWAIYNNSRLYALTFLYIREVPAVVRCTTLATMFTKGISQPAPLSCGLDSMSGPLLGKYASGTWIAPVCFESVMLVITMVKVFPPLPGRLGRLQRLSIMTCERNPTCVDLSCLMANTRLAIQLRRARP
ncbi:hypothetical protein B0H10DRAFT_1406702 [Mycena sp. CBHHK59/15]|nr:hypothetical protein B0H10DRAFT_1406702 [Mycena sp. CBHHK59/15]